MSCEIKRVILLTEAINTSPICIMYEGCNIVEDCQFAWSCDGVCFTDWVSYSDYLKLSPNVETDFYLKILISGGVDQVLINCKEETNYSMSLYDEGFTTNWCDDPNLFNPYQDLDCALLLQQQLADMVICMFGIPIYYFRCDPDLDSKDLTFKEFTLHNVVDCKQIKLMLQDGQLPSSNPRTTEFDFDWETDWETELSKTQFANAFGDTVYPKYGDFLYVPMMNRMWNVNAAYDEKQNGLMWRSTTWKLSLVKYEQFKNIQPNEFEGMIDNFINKTYQNTFEAEENNEQMRQSGINQTDAPRYAATNLYNIFHEDRTRKQVSYNDTQVLQLLICHNNNVVARNTYNFLNSNGCVVYQDGACGDSGTISMIFRTPKEVYEESTQIAEFGSIMFDFTYEDEKNYIECNELKLETKPNTTYMVVYKWNKSNMMRKLCLYEHKFRKDIPYWKLQPQLFWFDFENPTYVTDEYYEDDEMNDMYQCQIHGYPLKITNIKYYNVTLNDEVLIPELCKYTTTHESIIINDLARPLNSGRGYSVR